MIERDGNLITQVVADTKQNTLEPIIKTYVKKGSNLYSDEWYRHSNFLHKNFNHQIINHSAKQYVKGEITTNSIESAWACSKRSMYGIYHQVNKEHLTKYVNEFTFRFNTRNYETQETFDLSLLSSVGKSLSYGELISASSNNLTT